MRVTAFDVGKKASYVLMAAGLLGIFATVVFFSDALFFQTLVILNLLVAFTPVILVNYLEYRRIKAIELYLPDYLRDVSESVKSGMTLETAVEAAAKGHYGPLSEEMMLTAAQISWGIPFEETMRRFAERVNSKMVRQAVLITIESYKSGGDIADILETISADIRLLKEVEEKRKSDLQVYVISTYFIFMLFLAIIVILSKSFLPATPQLNMLAMILGGQTSNVSEEEYKNYFFHLTLIEAFFAGLVSGQMGEGSIIAGFKHSFVMIVITLAAFQFFLSPEPFASKIAGEILKIPPTAMTATSTEIPLMLTGDTTAAQVAEMVSAAAEEKKLEAYKDFSSDKVRFAAGDCKPCENGDLVIDADVVLVKKPSKIFFKVIVTRAGYRIDIRAP